MHSKDNVYIIFFNQSLCKNYSFTRQSKHHFPHHWNKIAVYDAAINGRQLFKPRNSNNSRLVFICINSYINPCVIFWHRSDLRNGVGWSLLPMIWLTINAVKEKPAISGKQMKHMSGSRKTDERVRADPDPEFTCICNKSYHQRDRIHFPAISHTDKCRSPVPDALYTVYRVCTDISRR